MKQLFLLIAFLPEPLYTVVMALIAIALVVFFCLFMYAVMMRVLGADFIHYTSYQEEAEDENIDHLHREYYVQDNSTGNKYTIKTNPDGRIERLSGNGYQIQPQNSVYIVEKGTSCLMTDANGNVLKEYELAIRP